MSAAGHSTEIDVLIRTCIDEVLETMFFTGARAAGCFPAVEGEVTPSTTVVLRFSGSPGGRMWLWLTSGAAGSLAASFLGLDAEEVGDSERDQMASELANMICGAVVSRFESDAAIELSSPAIVARDLDFGALALPPSTLTQCFQLEDGWMAVGFELGETECG